MKLQSIFMIILVMGLIFTMVGAVVSDFKVYYPNYQNVSTSWDSSYSNISYVNSSFFSLEKDLKAIQDEDRGWKKFLNTVVVIPKVLGTTVLIVLSSPVVLIQIISNISKDVGVPMPAEVLSVFIIMIIGSAIFLLIKFWKGGQPV